MNTRVPRHPNPASLLAIALLTACGAGDDRGNGWTTTTDTLASGAVLVHHTPPDDGIPATWRFDPELRIGTMDGDGPDTFGRIGDLAVHPDGRIVVLDRQAQEVRVFDPDGRHLETFGRQGGGPGEFLEANGAVFGPDRVLRVPDQQNARMSFLDIDRGFVGSHPYQPLMYAGSWEGVVDSAGNSWSLHFRVDTEDEESPGEMVFVALDTTGAAVDSMAGPWNPLNPDRNNPATWNITTSRGQHASIGVPFYARQLYILTPRLRVWSTTEGDPSYRVTRWVPGADTSLVIETERPSPPVDFQVADSIARAYEERFGAALDRSKIPEIAPAIEALFADDEHRLWVQVRMTDDSIHTFDAYDAGDGEYLGTLVTPHRIETRPWPVIRDDTVWAVVLDELDVPYVVRGRLASTAERVPRTETDGLAR